LQAQGTWSAGEADDKQRFLADMRALRDQAVLEFDELAARAHYPSDVLKEAESGPSLPTLPILAAYVRACDGDVPEWEERWRRLGYDSRADDGLPVRTAGASPAAVAGARASVGVAPPDAYDPERIRAALRGSHHGGRGAATRAASGRDTRGWGSVTGPDAVTSPVAGSVTDPFTDPGSAEPRVPDSPASWSPGRSWDETTRWDAGRSAETASGWGADAAGWNSAIHQDADPVTSLNGTVGNGNHHAIQPGGMASDAAVIETPDVTQAEAIRRDPFSADWLQDSELTPPPDIEADWTDQAEAQSTAAPEESWFTPRETADPEQIWPGADTQASPQAPDGWFTPRDRADDDLALPQPAERSAEPQHEDSEATIIGFWTPSAPASAPAPASAAATTPASASAESPASDSQDVASRTTAEPAQAAASGPSWAAAEPASPSRTIAEPAVPPGPVVPSTGSRPDRYYPVRLLVVIVVAALIGSILVLLLR